MNESLQSREAIGRAAVALDAYKKAIDPGLDMRVGMNRQRAFQAAEQAEVAKEQARSALYADAVAHLRTRLFLSADDIGNGPVRFPKPPDGNDSTRA